MSNKEIINNIDDTDVSEVTGSELIAVPEWVHERTFHIPLGHAALIQSEHVPDSSRSAAIVPGEPVKGSSSREKVIIGDLSKYTGGNPDHVIGFNGTVRK